MCFYCILHYVRDSETLRILPNVSPIIDSCLNIARKLIFVCFLFVFAGQIPLLAADDPLWKLDSKTLGIPKMWVDSQAKGESRYSRIRLQFTAGDEIVISFHQKRKQIGLVTKNTPEHSGSVLASLFISKIDGMVKNQKEWPVIGESGLWEQLRRGSRLQLLPSGYYIGIINCRLQLLDPTLSLLHDRMLDRQQRYDLITPITGPYFILSYVDNELNRDDYDVEIIDSRTFTTVEKMAVPDNVSIRDIWEDRMLAIAGSEQNGYHIKERRVDGPWNDIGSTGEEYKHARYTSYGKIAVTRHLPVSLRCCDSWFIMDGRNTNEACVYSNEEMIQDIMMAPHASIIAVKISKWSGTRAALDLNAVSWVVIHDIKTRRVLLKTKAQEGMIDYALSPNGRSLAILTEKKLEMYIVPEANVIKQ